MVYATGEGPLSRIEGIRLNDYNHGFQRVQLLKNLEPLPKLSLETRVVDIINDKVQVPSDETTYWCKLSLLPDEIKEKHHIIQYEAIIQPNNEQLVIIILQIYTYLQLTIKVVTICNPCTSAGSSYGGFSL